MHPARTRPRFLALLLLGWVAFARGGSGHGGVITPPPPPPPPPAPDPRTETIRRVGTPTPGPGSPAPTASPGTTGGIRPSGPTTGRRHHGESLDRWEYWWEANKELYLEPGGHAQSTTQATSFVGRAGDPPAVRRVPSDDVRTRILPALLAALASEEADVADSAALALARVVPAELANLALTPLERTLDHRERTAREAAALALGVLGSADALPTLRELLLDGEAGRRLTAHSAGVEENVRAFAAAALGLIGEPAAVDDLVALLDPAAPPPGRSVAQLALLALGMVHGRETERVAFLLKTIRQRGIDPVVRAAAPIALARVASTPEGESAARGVLGALVTLIEDEATEVDLRRSIAVALGRLARIEDGEALRALETLVQRGSDGPARQFALIALAEIGARDGDARRHGEAQTALERFLVRQLIDPSRPSLRPFAALALGIWGRSDALMPDARERAIAKLLEQFDSERNLSNQGAMALALGMLDSREAIAPLVRAFTGARDAAFKGHVALALGLLRARDHAATLREELARPGLTPLYETELARALGLMGDPRVVPLLIERLARADTFAEVSAVAQALGTIGDGSAVDPLLALLADAKAPAARRGVAAVTLGLLAQKSARPWNVPFKAGTNYCARSPALAEIADIL